MAKFIMIRELNGKQIAKKEEMEGLRGSLSIINPENSEIAKNLQLNEKGVFGTKSR